MEETDEFKLAVKIVIKRQMRDLIEQLRENGEEVAIISADINYGQSNHFGSPKGEWFIAEQRNLANSFLDFCKKKEKKQTELVRQSTQYSASTDSPRVVVDKLGDFHKETASKVIRVWVPEDLVNEVSDVDLAIVFGRLWMSQIEGVRKREGNSPAKNVAPKRLRTSRFQFCTLAGCKVDPETAHSVSLEQLDLLMEMGVPAIETFLQRNKLSKDGKLVKIIVAKSSFGNEIRIDVDKTQPDFDIIMPSGGDEDINLEMEFSDEPRKAESLSIDQEKDLIRKNNRKRNRMNHAKTPCEHCGMDLQSPQALKIHVKRVHLKIRNHKCPICFKGFWDRACVKTHTVTVHTKKCDACQEYVVESIPWEEGITVRTMRDIECACGATVTMFSKYGGGSATNAKSYKKTENNKKVTEQNVFQTPTNGKMFACGVCGKLFTSKPHCQTHSRNHSTEKPFVCEVCGMGKKSKVLLQSHMDKAHGIVTNGCKLCGRNFNSQKALKIHMGRQHPKEQEKGLSVDQSLQSNDNSLVANAQTMESEET